MESALEADLVCSFCSKGPTEVRRLLKGPGVAICDGCVHVCYEIIEGLDGETPSTNNAELPAAADEVMAAITRAQQAALDGERALARQAFAELWQQIGPDGDPLHRVTVAHYIADVQDDPNDALEWDHRALAAADALTDERAQEYHAALTVRGLYASLYLNVAEGYAKLGRQTQALEQLALAERAAADLPVDGYGDLVRSGISSLRDRLSAIGSDHDSTAGG